MLFRMIAVMALLIASTVAHAQGRTAVVDLEQAILQTDLAPQRIRDFEAREAFAEDRAEFDNLKAEFDKLVQNFQRDQAAMSEDEQVAARQKLASKNADLEYVVKKLQSLQQQNLQSVLQELAPSAQQVLREVIQTDNIALLLPGQSVIHFDPSYNITAKVTDKLNQLPQE